MRIGFVCLSWDLTAWCLMILWLSVCCCIILSYKSLLDAIATQVLIHDSPSPAFYITIGDSLVNIVWFQFLSQTSE